MGWQGEEPQPGLHAPKPGVSPWPGCRALPMQVEPLLPGASPLPGPGGGCWWCRGWRGGFLASPGCHHQVPASPCHLLSCPILLCSLLPPGQS